MVLDNQAITVVCPSAPRFPFETWLLPKRDANHFQASADLTEALHGTLQKMRRVTDMSAYNLGLHTGPNWRLEIIPRTTRLAGFELGTGVYIHEISPEQAAKALRGA
jgi:UDPglucose--hexose-1-phosphate uridylyltransferase